MCIYIYIYIYLYIYICIYIYIYNAMHLCVHTCLGRKMFDKLTTHIRAPTITSSNDAQAYRHVALTCLYVATNTSSLYIIIHTY